MPYEKVGKNEPVCIADEVPFDIPDSWEWAHISDMSYFQEGPGIMATDFRNVGIPLIRISGMQTPIVSLEGCNFLDADMVEQKWKHFKLDKGDIVISTSASMDKIAEVDEETVGAIPYTGLIRFKMYGKINKEYFKYFIKSPFYANQIANQASGAAIKHYGPSHLRKMIISVPPLNEQQRIVDKLEKLLPFLNAYTIAEEKLNTQHNSFPELLKKSILQEAVQGKLVPQDKNDEPAPILLERIRAEKQALIKAGKIKKDKNESVIFRRDNSHYEKLNGIERCIDDEIPFEIPDNWCWSRLGICLDVRDGTHDTPKYVPNGIPLVTSKNLCNGKIDFSTAKFITEDDHIAISQRSKVDNGDIMYAMIGSIGNPVLYYGKDEFSIKNMALFKKIDNGLLMEYVYCFLFFSQDNMKKYASGGVQSFVSLNYLRNYLIPIPPIQEQKRIVSAVEHLLSRIDTL